jgi:4'-phosphopantetheinyl transferase
MKVYWLEQTAPDVPDDNEWLSARELVQLGAMYVAKRRTEWQLGRWTAKLAVASCLQLPADLHNLASIEVRSSPSGAPETFLRSTWAPVTISLSHRDGKAICAVAPDGGGTLGCDLEVIEPHSDAFIADYFTREEQELVARAAAVDRPWLVTLLWSAKESALKALGAGLRLDTRCVIVTLVDARRIQDEEEVCVSGESIKVSAFTARQTDSASDWSPLQVRHIHDQTFFGWWQGAGNLLRTLVAAPPPARPRLLHTPLSTTSPAAAGSDQSQAA